jgi:hypothetical protein
MNISETAVTLVAAGEVIRPRGRKKRLMRPFFLMITRLWPVEPE